MMKLNPRSPLDLDIVKLTGRLLVFLHFIYALIIGQRDYTGY
jgi:hypothetical protein